MSDKNNNNENKDDNIVSLDTARQNKDKRDKEHKEKETSRASAKITSKINGQNDRTPHISYGEKPPPAINLPPATKYLLGSIIAVHVLITLILSPDMREWVYINLGFIPARFSGAAPFEAFALITPLTHMIIHGSWIHISMNGVMLAAFGTGVERWLGGKKMMQVFIISGLIGIALQYVLSPSSFNPVIGASGGLSGLFAAAIIMFNKVNGAFQSKYGIWPVIGVVMATYFIFGFMGSPDGNAVAWAAHIGGFLGGFVALKLLKINFK